MKVNYLRKTCSAISLFLLVLIGTCKASAQGCPRPISLDYITEVIIDPQPFEPGNVKIKGKIHDKIADSAYNLYVSDEYLHIGDNPTECVVVKGKKFKYNIHITEMRELYFQTIFKGQKNSDAGFRIAAIPGQKYKFHIHNGCFDYKKYRANQFKQVDGTYWAREHFNNTTPHLKPIKANKSWNNVSQQADSSLIITEVHFADTATVIRATTSNTISYNFSQDSYLAGINNTKYKFKCAQNNSVKNWTMETSAFGDYFYFEPMPINTEKFALIIENDTIIENICDSKSLIGKEPNFKMNITGKPGSVIGIPDFEEHYANENGSWSIKNYTIDNSGKLEYQTYLPEDMRIELRINGRKYFFNYIQNQEANIVVERNTYNVSGTEYYNQWGAGLSVFNEAKKKHFPNKAKKQAVIFTRDHNQTRGGVDFMVNNIFW